jgi:Toprim domain
MTRASLIDRVKPLANARRFELLHALGVHAAPRGKGTILMSDPMSKDRNPSLAIYTHGGALSFVRYGSDAKGDVIDCVAYLQGWYDLPGKGRREALRWLCDFTGVARMNEGQRRADAARANKRIAEEQKHAGEKLARDQDQAFKLFKAAAPLEGSPAESYLQNRGIDLRDLPAGVRGGERRPSALRYLPAHRHTESGAALPCLIAACVDYRAAPPAIRAVHRTWLKADGSGKADVAPNKKVWPSFRGLVIPLWRGADNLSIGEAIKHGVRETLVLTEGIEDGLSAALGNPALRVWAAISLGNLANVPIPQCIDGIIVHRQSDWQKLQAVAAFERAIAALEASGRPVVIVEAMTGKDLNDTLRGEG